MSELAVKIQNLHHRYGSTIAVNDIYLEIPKVEQ